MAEWIEKRMEDIADFNPRESLIKGSVAKKIAMDKLQPFCRDIPNFEIESFFGGTKFRNNDTIMARITPCLENGKTAKVNILEEDEIGFGSTEFMVFRAKEETDPDFLYYLIISPIIREPAIKSMVGSSGRQRVQTDVVQKLMVTYIGFTGTPISSADRSTREVFGDYIDIYDMTQAVEDGATRPVYYESRVIKLNLDENTLRLMDAEYDTMAANADAEVIEKSKHQLGQMEVILGNDQTINSLVCDILDHYENNRENLLTGKAMIVAYSRPIAMKIYKRILELRPSWKEKVGVVMTSGNNDPEEWREIIGNKQHKDELAKKFKDNNSPMKIAIVVDMWLTGFDVPSLATMYVYKPMMV